MNSVLNYGIYMILCMLLCFPIYLLFRVMFIKWRHIKINKHRERILLLFSLYLMGLAFLTVFPIIRFTSSGIEIFYNGINDMNLIPFRILYDTYIEVTRNHNFTYFLVSFLGNIVIFIPIGIFIKLLWPKLSNSKIILYGFCISLFIEICQIPLPRTTDIDDLLCNTFGVYLGVLCYRIWKRYVDMKEGKNEIGNKDN